MDLGARIYIAGHRGLVGSALLRRLHREGYRNLITRTHAELDLERPEAVADFFAKERLQYVFLAAAKVGGIYANAAYPVDFLLRNLKIAINVIEASWRHTVEGLLFLGSSCIYPKLAPQPLKEEYVLTGLLEPTNEPYAIAKIAGLQLCEAYNRQYGTRFLGIMPSNLYGLEDNYDLETSHVLPALIRKFHLAKLAAARDWKAVQTDEMLRGPIPADFRIGLETTREFDQAAPGAAMPKDSDRRCGPIVRLWGTGSPRREFLFSDDLADACVFLMDRLDDLFEAADSACEIEHPAPDSRQATSPMADVKTPLRFPRFAEERSLAANHLVNVGSGEDHSLKELAARVAHIVGFRGLIEWDLSKPDGTPQKLLDSSRIMNLGWVPKTGLDDGIRLAYQDYLHKEES